MQTRPAGVCIYCGKPADLRTGKVTQLRCGARLHNLCHIPLLQDIAEGMLRPTAGTRLTTRFGPINRPR